MRITAQRRATFAKPCAEARRSTCRPSLPLNFRSSQAVTDLPLRNFVVLPFNFDHAMTAGLLMRQLERDAGDRRDVVKDDVKLIAQAVCESVSHVFTEDRHTLAKYVRRFNDAGQSSLKVVLLADGFEAAWFDDGQQGIPGT